MECNKVTCVCPTAKDNIVFFETNIVLDNRVPPFRLFDVHTGNDSDKKEEKKSAVMKAVNGGSIPDGMTDDKTDVIVDR